MMNDACFVPERWLFLSSVALDAIRDGWAANAGPDTLLRMRVFDPRIVTEVDLLAFEEQVEALGKEGVRTVHVVVDRLTLELATRRAALKSNVDVQFREWKVSPQAVIVSLSAPDGGLLDQVLGSKDSVSRISAETSATSTFDQAWWTRYRAALRTWEIRAREAYGEDFTATYGPSIPWEKWIPKAPSFKDRAAAGLSRTIDCVLETVTKRPAYAGTTVSEPGRTFCCVVRAQGYQIELKYRLSSRSCDPVEVYASVDRGALEPRGFRLAFDGEVSTLELDEADWKDALTEAGKRMAVWSIEDPQGSVARTIAMAEGIPSACKLYVA